jgi:hypothetical protein
MAKSGKVAGKKPAKAAGAPATGSTRGRTDGRVQVLLYMRPDLVVALKAAAIEDDTTAFRLNEKAVEAFLKTRSKKRAPRPTPEGGGR